MIKKGRKIFKKRIGIAPVSAENGIIKIADHKHFMPRDCSHNF
jgi:hypothetical protein